MTWRVEGLGEAIDALGLTDGGLRVHLIEYGFVLSEHGPSGPQRHLGVDLGRGPDVFVRLIPMTRFRITFQADRVEHTITVLHVRP